MPVVSGKRLRTQVVGVDALLTDVWEFLKEKGKLHYDTKNLICELREAMNDLFYKIPLEK